MTFKSFNWKIFGLLRSPIYFLDEIAKKRSSTLRGKYTLRKKLKLVLGRELA